MTNYEKIKAMSVEEMEEVMSQRFDCAVCLVCDAWDCGGAERR